MYLAFFRIKIYENKLKISEEDVRINDHKIKQLLMDFAN